MPNSVVPKSGRYVTGSKDQKEEIEKLLDEPLPDEGIERIDIRKKDKPRDKNGRYVSETAVTGVEREQQREILARVTPRELPPSTKAIQAGFEAQRQAQLATQLIAEQAAIYQENVKTAEDQIKMLQDSPGSYTLDGKPVKGEDIDRLKSDLAEYKQEFRLWVSETGAQSTLLKEKGKEILGEVRSWSDRVVERDKANRRAKQEFNSALQTSIGFGGRVDPRTREIGGVLIQGIPGPAAGPRPGSFSAKLQERFGIPASKIVRKGLEATETPFTAVTKPIRGLGESMIEKAVRQPSLLGTSAYLTGVGLGTVASAVDVATFGYRPGLQVETAKALGYLATDSDLRKEFVKTIAKDPFKFTAEFFGGMYLGGKLHSVGKTIGEKAPAIKKGKISIPTASGGKIEWEGLYLDFGKRTKALTGKFQLRGTEGELLSSQKLLEAQIYTGGKGGYGYIPESSLEAVMTIKLMKKMGYSTAELEKVSNIRNILFTAEKIKSKSLKDVLPKKTSTISEKGIDELKSFLRENPQAYDRIYGSYAVRNQLNEAFEFVLAENQKISALRKPGDIDMILTGTGDDAARFVQKLNERLIKVGEKTRVSPENPLLIESKGFNKDWVHAIDAHLSGMPTPEGDIITPYRWGFKTDQPAITMEKLNIQPLSEQGVRKGTIILGFGEGKSLGPVSWRRKDVVDFLQISQTLETSRPFYKKSFQPNIDRLIELYNVKDIKSIQSNIFDTPVYVSPAQASKAYQATSGVKSYTPTFSVFTILSKNIKNYTYSAGQPIQSPSSIKAYNPLSSTSPTPTSGFAEKYDQIISFTPSPTATGKKEPKPKKPYPIKTKPIDIEKIQYIPPIKTKKKKVSPPSISPPKPLYLPGIPFNPLDYTSPPPKPPKRQEKYTDERKYDPRKKKKKKAKAGVDVGNILEFRVDPLKEIKIGRKQR